MLNGLVNFFYMHGYGGYIWIAYGSVLILLLIQWLIPWKRWKKYLHEQNS
jgi:heme exporter protein CcmD